MLTELRGLRYILYVLLAAVITAPAIAQTQYGPGRSKGPVSTTPQFITGWQQLRTGMTGDQVGALLGTDWHHRIHTKGVQYEGTWIVPATNSFKWWRVDHSKGFERRLWFEVEFRYAPSTRRWGASKKQVNWTTEKYFDGSGVYGHYDVSDEFR